MGRTDCRATTKTGRTARRPWSRFRRAGAAAGAVVVALLFVGTAIAVQQITIGSAGFAPRVLTTDGQQDLSWTNDTPFPQAVVSTEGLFGSGPIPSGGGYSMKLQVPGTHPYQSSFGQNHQGTIVVGLHGLSGPPGDPAADHIPNVPFPPVADGDVQIHPRW